MTLAKGRLVVSQEDLHKLFNLPENVEILSVKAGGGDFEFLLASAVEEFSSNGTQVTVETDNLSNVRRVSLKSLKNTVEYKAGGFRIDASGGLSLNGDMTIINGNEKISPTERYDVGVTINHWSEETATSANEIAKHFASALKKLQPVDSTKKEDSVEGAFEQAVNNATNKKGKK